MLPVIPKKPPTVIVGNYIKSSPLWPLFSVVKLKKNVRAAKKRLILHHDYPSWEMDLGADTAICDDQIEANNYPVEFLNPITLQACHHTDST